MKTKISFIALIFWFSFIANSQDLTNNMKGWSGISIAYEVSPKIDVKLSQLFAFNFSPARYSFSQTKLSLAYRLIRRTYAGIGYSRGLFNESNSLKRQGATSGWFNTLAIERVHGNFSYKHDVVKRISLKHKVEFQYFFADLDKYKTRSIYSTRLVYNVRRSSLSPYIENQFFYYSGGEISNGFKRHRFKLGLSFKPFKKSAMRVSMYYFLQNEFSTDQLPDNDYSVLGFNLSFKIN